ncbi:MAG: radical SAM protein [Lentisphaerae bacterium]|nr:radical SAM protein [Lentisphaerota bacterium]
MEESKARKFIFGPINSRRLGKSLGVDLVTAKTCSLDCIYCEAKATTNLTMTRKEYVPVDKVIAELDATLKNIPKPDYITFSGAGEPTLNSGIGCVVDHIKKYHSESLVCLLTNGLLLGDTVLQKELSQLDLIIPSLDASSEEEYSYINRPYPGETLEKLVSGLCSFRRNVPVKMALEIFVVPGINDSDESIARFYRLVKCIDPDLIHLNTLDRRGVIAELSPASRERMEKFASVLGKIAPAEIFGPTKEPHIPHK